MSRLALTSLVFLLVLVSAKPQEAFSCSVELIEGISPNNNNHGTTYMCESSCATYFLTGDVAAFLEEKEIYLELGARQRLVVPRSAVENGSIDVDKHGSTIDVAPMWNAIAALATNAPRKLLVVRVESKDKETSPSVTEEQLKHAYFEKPNSVKNFFAKCSKNSQIVIPAGNTNNKGVITVTYPGNTHICNGYVGRYKERTQESITSSRAKFYNLVSQYDYTNVVWIYPECVWFGGAAGWGSRPGKDVWILSRHSLKPIVMVHEFGHNLGLGHSGENGVPYGDKTCYMGNMGGVSGGWSEDGIDTCFNAAKMWQLGWYPQYRESYAPFQWASPNEITVDLVGYNDVVTNNQISANQRALVEIKGGQFDSLYIMYNVPEGIVSGVPVHKNLVHIVIGKRYGTSDFQEALSTGQTFNYNGVVIRVQTMKNGVATILIKKPIQLTSAPTPPTPSQTTKQPTKSCPDCQYSKKGSLTCCRGDPGKGGWKGKCANTPTAAKPYTWDQGVEVCEVGRPKCSQCGLSEKFLTCCFGAWKDNCGKGKDHSWAEGVDACKDKCTCAKNSKGVWTCCAGRGSWYGKCADSPTLTHPYTWKEGKAQCRVNNAVAYAALDIPKEASSDSDAETDYPSLLDDKCDNDTTNKTSETTTKGAISSPISSPLVSSSFPVEPAFLLSLSLFTLY